MRILIIGPGALGCLFAGLLSESGHDVTVLDRDPERAGLIGRKGITISDISSSRTIPVRITADPHSVEIPDFACLLVKSYDTRSAVERSLPAIGKSAPVITFQNGAGNAEIISESMDAGRIICAATTQGSTVLEPGHIRHAGRGPTFLAPLKTANTGQARTFGEILTQAGIITTVVPDAQSMLWSKLIINAAINPLTALADLTNGELLENDELKEAMYSVAREAYQVAVAKGIKMPYTDPASEAEKACRTTADNISSMLQDIRNGKRTEIESITGTIVREAVRLGIETPANEILLEAIKKRTEQAPE